MEGNTNQGNSTNNSENPIHNSDTSASDVANPANQQVLSAPAQTITHEEDGKTIVINVFIPQSENTEVIAANNIARDANAISKKSNDITRRGIRINAGLVFLTGILAWIAISQSNSAIRAAEIADSTLQATREYNTKSLKLQQDAFDSNNADAATREKREIERSKRDRLSLNAQLQTIKETKNEFEIENQPFLQVNKISIDTFKVGEKCQVTFNLYNTGKLPARIIVMNANFGFFYTKSSLKVPHPPKYPKIKIGNYIGGQTSEKLTVTGGTEFNQETINAVTKGEVYILLAGKCSYINIADKNQYIYYFKYKLFKDPSYHEEIIQDSVKRVGRNIGVN